MLILAKVLAVHEGEAKNVAAYELEPFFEIVLNCDADSVFVRQTKIEVQEEKNS